MGYGSGSGTFWTVNRQPDGRYRVVRRTGGAMGKVVEEAEVYDADKASYAGAAAAKRAYEQGRQEAKGAAAAAAKRAYEQGHQETKAHILKLINEA